MCVIRVLADCAVEIALAVDDNGEVTDWSKENLNVGQEMDVDIYFWSESAADMQLPDGSTFSMPLEVFCVLLPCGHCELVS